MSSAPIRVVVVHYGDHALTLDCIDRLLAAGGPLVDVVAIDNGGGPPLVESFPDPPANMSIRVGASSLGFGGGANLGLSDLTGIEMVALVNNDVLVEPGWLDPLVATLDNDETIGAAAPKILLRDRFRAVGLEVPTTEGSRLDRRRLGVRILGARIGAEDVTDRIRYPKGTWGPEWNSTGGSERWTTGSAHLLVPMITPEIGSLELMLAARVPTAARCSSGNETSAVNISTVPAWHRIAASGPAFDVLHNAGTSIDRYGYGVDRGFLEPDGERWSRPEDVFAWCGAAVLLRASYLQDVGLFDPSLFLYYEDVDLSWRGHEHGWRYRYTPESLVRHVHSATAGRDPIGTLTLNERNRLLVLARHGTHRRTAQALVRTAAITASYAARDIVNPLLYRKPVRFHHSGARMRALAGFAVRAPRELAGRASGVENSPSE